LTLVTPPAAAPVSVVEVRAQCRVTDASEDALLAGYIRSATDLVEGMTNTRLISQTWSWSIDSFPCWKHEYLRLPLAPAQSVTEITYLDTIGLERVLDSSVYMLRRERLLLAPGKTWPSTWHGVDVITITFVAGFGPDHNSVPEALRQAVMMLASYWYSQREAASIGPDSGPVSDVPFSVRALCDSYRTWPV
jgi:uncharacterized phiE125 gp8 family phage protein